MPFGNVNPMGKCSINTPYGQYVYNYTHPRKPLCSVPNGHKARTSGQINGSKDRCEVNNISLEEHGMHFLPRIHGAGSRSTGRKVSGSKPDSTEDLVTR
ncbi:hypothetical protein AVEN_148747-1 [Araneus ventricosus]|uniref:Uncharacterized protein n=1 Tax=Araneus ventricosus TaxID=182803 RepID=A0A4Y2BA66_ARAVE|nr:hypothetical protein AVEN_62228-1 [Araneus ventricosus]GBL89008.1 hypothetical protein AVEN_148747-1 [Araneus ventricosus]